MIRVVNDGYLCTRNGRIIKNNFYTTNAFHAKIRDGMQICYNEDIEYDFGGHIWSGRISWLRKAWNHIPFSLDNCEDFWISAVLKTFYNISTKIPKCPCPEVNPIIPDFCAASDTSSSTHQNAHIGKSTILHKIRHKLIKEITEKFNYQRLSLIKPEYIKNIKTKYKHGYNLFNLSDSLWKNALHWLN